MEEKESTVSASLENSDTDDSPRPVSSNMVNVQGAQQQPQLMNMNVNMSLEERSNTANNIGNIGNVSNIASVTNVASVAPANIGSNNSELFGKKKRGRPRKYDAEGNLRVQPNIQQAMTPPGFSFSSSTDHAFSSSGSSSKRGRGRPPGSGNWQLLASLGEIFASTAGGDFTPHIITVNTGEDVAGKILSFSQKGTRGLCVLSANGAVSNVTLRQPGSAGGILTYEGRFEILSLSGSYAVTDNGGVKSRTGGLSVSLASPDGRVIGGGVAGLLLAASPIQIVLGSFMPNGFKTQKIRKQQREQAIASVIPSGQETITPAKPISQAKPEGDQPCLQSILPIQTQSHGATENNGNGNGHQIGNVGSFHLTGWNGIDSSTNQRPSPDINVTVASEDEVEGVL